MKNTKNIKLSAGFRFFLMLLSICFLSCEDFLEEDPKDRVAQSNFYNNEQDAISAVNSIYANLGSHSSGSTAGIYHSTFWVTVGLASDNLWNNHFGMLQNDQLASFSYNAENSNLLEIWTEHYETINLANIAIERIPVIDMDESRRTQLVNEAKFLRGLLYFNLVRMFGEIPLVISEDMPLNPEKVAVEQIYTQIIQDLQDAEALPQDGDIQEGRATSGASKALLANVYLTREDYQNASDKALEVIQSGLYELWEDYAEVFRLANRGGKEAIFSVGFGDGGGAISFWEVGQFNVRLLPVELSRERSSISNTQGWQYATNDLFEAFSSEDERRDVTFLTEFENDAGEVVELEEVYIQKYWDRIAEPNAGNSEQDFPVMRYSELLLIYAEAQAELGNLPVANEYLNMIKNRANLPSVDINNLEAFKEELLLERRKEFVAEGQRWFELVRTGELEEKVQNAKDIQVNQRYYLFPLPQEEVDVNPNLSQNPNY